MDTIRSRKHSSMLIVQFHPRIETVACSQLQPWSPISPKSIRGLAGPRQHRAWRTVSFWSMTRTLGICPVSSQNCDNDRTLDLIETSKGLAYFSSLVTSFTPGNRLKNGVWSAFGFQALRSNGFHPPRCVVMKITSARYVTHNRHELQEAMTK